MRLISILPALILFFSLISNANSGFFYSNNISFIYNQYGEISNLSYENSIIIKEIKFSEKINGTWTKDPLGMIYENNLVNININKIGVIDVNTEGISFEIDINDGINITRAITFNGIISKVFVIRFSGNFIINGDDIISYSRATIFLNISEDFLDQVSSPQVGGVIFINGTTHTDFVYVNYSYSGNMDFSFNFNGSPKYFVFIFNGKTNNLNVLLNGKIYENYTVENENNSTIYKVLLPPGNNTISFIKSGGLPAQDFIALSIISLTLIIGIIMLYWVRKK